MLGINAHVNYDLPQAMLSVISPADFDDEQLLQSRRRDHEGIDEILGGRVKDEDDLLGDSKTLLDRLLTPLNRLGSKRFLREARHKVWHNVQALNSARCPAAMSTLRVWPNLRCSAPPVSLTCSRPARCCCGSPPGFGVTLRPASEHRHRPLARDVCTTGVAAMASQRSAARGHPADGNP